MAKLATSLNNSYLDAFTPRQNHLLDAFPESIYERIFPHLVLVPMFPGEIIYDAYSELSCAYFPITCIVSKVVAIENGAATEIAIIGNEGMVDVALFVGGKTMTNRAIIRNEGYAYRLKRQHFMREFNRLPVSADKGILLNLMLRYTQSLITQVAQAAVCNRFHSIEQRFCRWLLQSVDRLGSNELNITQESIAHMLGVRREAITEAAGKLQRADLIDYSRGHITVLNRAGLEERVCECYQVVKNETDRLLQS
jgi:hypothetical protein